jgi:hypothetical protein
LIVVRKKIGSGAREERAMKGNASKRRKRWRSKAVKRV